MLHDTRSREDKTNVANAGDARNKGGVDAEDAFGVRGGDGTVHGDVGGVQGGNNCSPITCDLINFALHYLNLAISHLIERQSGHSNGKDISISIRISNYLDIKYS